MLKAKFAAAGLPSMPSVTHIVPLLVGCPVKAKISDILLASTDSTSSQSISRPCHAARSLASLRARFTLPR
jgi:hypothetical protein